MKRARFIVLVIVAILLVPAPTLAGPEIVSICHLTGNGQYVPIDVSASALPAHLAHGDLRIGIEVDENCEPLIIPVCMIDQGGLIWNLNLNRVCCHSHIVRTVCIRWSAYSWSQLDEDIVCSGRRQCDRRSQRSRDGRTKTDRAGGKEDFNRVK